MPKSNTMNRMPSEGEGQGQGEGTSRKTRKTKTEKHKTGIDFHLPLKTANSILFAFLWSNKAE